MIHPDVEICVLRLIIAVFLLAAGLAGQATAQTAPATQAPAAGQTQQPAQQSTTPPAPATDAPSADEPAIPPLPGDATNPDGADAPAVDGGDEDVSMGEIPDVDVIELKPDVSRKALDTYILVRDKYKDENFEDYQSYADFVAKSPKGKDFETDIKSNGFASIDEWYTVITNLTFAYANMVNDQTEEFKQQIEEVKNDTTMAQDMKDRMIKAFSAMIPSDNNKKVIEEMAKDPAYAEKIKALENEAGSE